MPWILYAALLLLLTSTAPLLRAGLAYRKVALGLIADLKRLTAAYQRLADETKRLQNIIFSMERDRMKEKLK